MSYINTRSTRPISGTNYGRQNYNYGASGASRPGASGIGGTTSSSTGGVGAGRSYSSNKHSSTKAASAISAASHYGAPSAYANASASIAAPSSTSYSHYGAMGSSSRPTGDGRRYTGHSVGAGASTYNASRTPVIGSSKAGSGY